MVDKPVNWGQVGQLLPIESLAESYKGPVVLAHIDDERTVRWFSPEGANRSPIDHVEHVRDGEKGFLHHERTEKQAAEGEPGDPITTTVRLTPTHWAVAEIVG